METWRLLSRSINLGKKYKEVRTWKLIPLGDVFSSLQAIAFPSHSSVAWEFENYFCY